VYITEFLKEQIANCERILSVPSQIKNNNNNNDNWGIEGVKSLNKEKNLFGKCGAILK
jgi:hypothetical protein